MIFTMIFTAFPFFMPKSKSFHCSSLFKKEWREQYAHICSPLRATQIDLYLLLFTKVQQVQFALENEWIAISLFHSQKMSDSHEKS